MSSLATDFKEKDGILYYFYLYVIFSSAYMKICQ